MKKPIYLFFTALLLSSCGGEGNNDQKNGIDSTEVSQDEANINAENLDMSNMKVVLDLSDHELPITMKMPDSAMVLHEEGDFLWDIMAGEKYQLQVELMSGMENIIQNKKKEITSLYKGNVEFLVDKEDLIMYKALLPSVDKTELEKMKSSERAKMYFHHVYAKVNIDGEDYAFKTNEGIKIFRPRALDMLKAIESIQMK